MKTLMTVCGKRTRAELGHFQPHEHIFVHATPASEKNPALRIDDEARSLTELRSYYAAGGRTILDAQPVGAGRDIAALRRLSLSSGVNIISVTGYHLPVFYPKEHWIFNDDEDSLRERFARELAEGVECGGEHVFPGAVKAAIGADGIEGRFAACLSAAAAVAAQADVPLIFHTEKGIAAVEAVLLCEKRGLSPDRIVVCHADRQAEDYLIHEEIARTGAYLEYDTIARYRYHDDESELRLIQHMLELGCENRLLISLDTTAARFRSYVPEAPGLDFIIKQFLPMLAANGIAKETLDNITINNPARLFGLL